MLVKLKPFLIFKYDTLCSRIHFDKGLVFLVQNITNTKDGRGLVNWIHWVSHKIISYLWIVLIIKYQKTRQLPLCKSHVSIFVFLESNNWYSKLANKSSKFGHCWQFSRQNFYRCTTSKEFYIRYISNFYHHCPKLAPQV